MADSSREGSVDNAVGAATATQSPSTQALSRVEPAQSESGLFSGESVLNILKLIFAGAPLPDVLTIIARLVEAEGKGMFCTIWLLDEDGRYVRCATAPSLPGFTANWERTPVGPTGGPPVPRSGYHLGGIPSSEVGCVGPATTAVSKGFGLPGRVVAGPTHPTAAHSRTVI